LPFIYGTVLTSFLALVISVPLGVGAAIFLSELAPPPTLQRLYVSGGAAGRRAQRDFGPAGHLHLVPLMRQYIEPFLKDALGTCPLFQGPAYGVGYLTAGLILAIMTFPFIISISREALLAVPREQREAALALGATKWESTWQGGGALRPAGHSGIDLPGAGARLGETMASPW
jgi:phosphate transport system permease protein